ncbi:MULTISPECIES: SH3 domain-containing protein [unclassified Sporosarcina]|uniref:SH3 domain-containing protein n=1 Tax=unclassified Sporosarcina TaxID=2647733 RepID=UPI00203D8244|nr:MULTISPECIES: SH3 domain-containing protein [unclassified Sporosarcina]GKV65927.1 hypothetical protein NCCP2331_20800 [Sporosarcina sp. NCCP-2331]GLB56073.1 hypothetical protein NCCP2378_18600 [Sporosarcina sp. NCCP-2378]
MRKMTSTSVIMFLLIGFFYVLAPQTTEAAGSTDMYVHAKNDIVLRAKPSQNANRLGTVKNKSKVKVLSSSNGWSHIHTGKSKGYVYTSALSKKNPNAVSAPTTVSGGLMPVNGLILTYSPSFLDESKETFTAKREGNSAYLFSSNKNSSSDYPNYVYFESKTNFVMGVSESDHMFVEAPLPLKQGSYFTVYNYESSYKVLVESTTKTVKVKGGTFKNVVILRYPNGAREYLAKGIGIIKSTDSKGKTYTELSSVKQWK